MDYRLSKIIYAVTVLMVIVSVIVAIPSNASAQSIIRDREIEKMFSTWFAPIIDAANLNQNAVNVILVRDSQINAFVAGGPNVFFFTGLLMESRDPGEIIGVFSHELGHIRGGHLIRGRQALERASYETLIGTILGLGAAIASGQGGAAGAIASGTQSQALRRFLSHSRVQESSADQAGLNFMTTAQMSPKGLISFFETLQSKQSGPQSRQVEYTRTHPLTGNRISALVNEAQKSPYFDKEFPEQWYREYDLMRAKLIGFLQPGHVAWIYNQDDKTTPAQYARAIAAYRLNQFDQALKRVDALIKAHPNHAYFYELKGQILVDAGRLQDSLPPYRQALDLDPEAGLIGISLAHALIEASQSNAEQEQAYLTEAIDRLKESSKTEERSSRLQRLMATAYGRLGQTGLASLHLAEEAVLRHKWKDARQHANIAKNALEETEQKVEGDYLRVLDLIEFVDNNEKK